MRKLAVFTLGFAAACFAAQYFIPAGLLLWLSGGALLLLLPALLLRGDRRVRAVICLCGVALSFALCRAHYLTHDVPAAALAGQTADIEAEIAGYPEQASWGSRVPVRVGGLRTYLYLDDFPPEIRPGDIIRLRAALKLPGENIRDYYNAGGVYLTASQAGEPDFSGAARMPVRYWPAAALRALNKSIDGVFPPDVSGFVKAVVTGDDSGLAEGFASALGNTGLTHAVVVSGMHFTYLLGFLFFFTGKGRRRKLAAIPFALLFMAVTGFTPSVVRAGIMAIIMLLAPALRREYDAPTGLALSLLIILAANPDAAGSVSLQLSFASIGGIIAFSPRLYDAFRRKLCARWRIFDRPLRYICLSLSATLGAMAFTVPLIAAYFGRVSVLAPLANLVALPVVSVVFIIGAIVGIIGIALPAFAAVLAWTAWPFARYFEWATVLLGRTQTVSFSTQNAFLTAWLFFAYLIVLLMLCARKPGKYIYVPVACLLVAFCAAGLASLLRASDTLCLMVADVGQGSCAVLSSGSASAVFDCGGYDAADAAQAALSATGKTALDALVLTHLHADHAGGAAALLSCVRVKTLFLPETDDPDDLLPGILEAASAYGTRVVYVVSDISLSLSGTKVSLFAPLGEGENEAGLTALITQGNFDALITGDMSAGTEERLALRYELPKTEVFVVSHHGSANGSGQTLLDEIRPETAIISVGAGNKYGHPSPKTLSRLEAAGAAVYRTDTDGRITITRW